MHETYLRLLDVERVRWNDTAHFLALTAIAMRRVLVDYARRHRALKRGAGQPEVELTSHALVLDEAASLSAERADQMIALDAALQRLAGLNERLARIVEMRFFGGMTVEETGRALDLAESTVKLDWQKAKAWLYRELAAS